MWSTSHVLHLRPQIPEYGIWKGSQSSYYTHVTLSKCNISSISSIVRPNVKTWIDFSCCSFSFIFLLMTGRLSVKWSVLLSFGACKCFLITIKHEQFIIKRYYVLWSQRRKFSLSFIRRQNLNLYIPVPVHPPRARDSFFKLGYWWKDMAANSICSSS